MCCFINPYPMNYCGMSAYYTPYPTMCGFSMMPMYPPMGGMGFCNSYLSAFNSAIAFNLGASFGRQLLSIV